MDAFTKIDELLEVIDRPAFWVQDGVIVQANQIAKNRLFCLGTPIRSLLPSESPEYQNFTQGFLHLTVFPKNIPCKATAIRYQDGDLFLLERNFDRIQLQTLALAAQQLRTPLANIMAVTDELLPELMLSEDETLRDQASHVNKGLFQILRLLANMADAERYFGMDEPTLELTSLPGFFDHLMEKVGTLVEQSGRTLRYTGYPKRRYGLADREKLERAVYNMISNAVKFSPEGSEIHASVSIDEDRFRFSVRDFGDGISPQVWGTLYARYQREPSVEDSRFGLGLGMTMINTAASIHGGTVLIDQPEGGGTRVTLSIKLSRAPATLVRTPSVGLSNYTGGWDSAMVEFSQFLPVDSYQYNSKDFPG